MSDPVVLLSTGDVVGPAGGVTDNSMVLFSGTSGKLIKGNNAQVTSAGLALLDDIDTNAQLTTLGLTTTQPQFDNSVKQATTAFVQRALGNKAGYVYYSEASVVLTAADAGKNIYLAFVGAVSVTLPAGTLAGGVTFNIICSSSTKATVSIAGGGTFAIPMGAGGTSFVVAAATNVEFSSLGSANIYLAMNGAGAAYLGTNGYQRLPSGLIIQWGTTSWTGEAISWTYPLAFPVAASSVFANINTDNGGAIVQEFNTTAAYGSSTISGNNSTGTHSYNWLAIGY